MNDNRNESIKSSHDDKTAQKLQNLSRRGLNAVTGGAWNKVRNTPLIGNAAKRGEEKLANKLGNNKLVQKMGNPMNHQRPNLGVATKENVLNPSNAVDKTSPINTPKNDIGSRNLQKSLTNKARNLWNNRNRNRNDNTSIDSTSSDSGENNASDSSNNLSIKEEAAIVRKRIMIIKVTLIGLALFSFMFIILVIAQIVTGGTAIPSAPLVSSKNYGTSDFESITDEDSKQHDNEIKYYKKLKELSNDYGDSVNINYVNALLMNLYYEAGFESDDEELLNETSGIDFAKMTDLAGDFAKIINDCNSDDYEIDGVIFNKLKNNNKILDYYKPVLENTTIEEVLKDAFYMAKELEAADVVDDTVVTNETTVTVTSTGAAPTSLSMKDYLADSIYATSPSFAANSVKAYTIAYSTNVVAQNKKLTIDSNTASASNNLCSVTLGCSYDDKGNLVSGPGKQNSQNVNFYNGQYYYKIPLTSSEISSLNTNINAVYGNVLVNSDGTYPTLNITKINGLGDGDYKTILNNSYGSLTIKNIGENSYVQDESYGTKKVRTDVIFYDQNNYSTTSFCGLKRETIETSGCGITSMAMVMSTYENNKKYDPIYMNKEATNKKMCGAGSGTSQAFFCKEARAMGYKCTSGSKYSKTLLNDVLKHLSQGHLVIARMGPSHFTGGGHYIVLGGVDPDTKKVYVYDPNHRDNSKAPRKTGNGWYSFNDIIAKEAYNFYIIWKG